MKLKETFNSMLPLLLAIVVGAIVIGLLKKSPLADKIGLADADSEEFEAEDFDAEDYESFEKFAGSGNEKFSDALYGSPLENYSGNNMDQVAESGKSTFTLKVTRTGTTDGELPVSLFGPLDAMNGYNRTITSDLVDFSLGSLGGFTLTEGAPNTNTVKTYANRNTAQFEYANDSIAVTSQSSIGYPSFVQSLVSNSILVRGFRMTVSNTTTGLDQFGNTITVRDESLFGKIVENSIVPESDKSPNQFQTNILNIGKRFLLTANTTFNFNMVSVAQTVTFTFYVERSLRQPQA